MKNEKIVSKGLERAILKIVFFLNRTFLVVVSSTLFSQLTKRKPKTVFVSNTETLLIKNVCYIKCDLTYHVVKVGVIHFVYLYNILQIIHIIMSVT